MIKVQKVTRRYLNRGVTELVITGKYNESGMLIVPMIVANDIRDIATKCPEMVRLSVPYITSWPTLDEPMLSLKSLIVKSSSACCFNYVELHRSVPNLMVFELGGCTQQTTVPNLNGCKKLRKVCLTGEGLKFRLYPRIDGGSWRWTKSGGAIIGRRL